TPRYDRNVRYQAVFLAAIADELAVALHRAQACDERSALALFAYAERDAQVLERHGRAVALEHLQHIRPTRHRMLVAGRLLRMLRISLFPAFLFGHQAASLMCRCD